MKKNKIKQVGIVLLIAFLVSLIIFLTYKNTYKKGEIVYANITYKNGYYYLNKMEKVEV